MPHPPGPVTVNIRVDTNASRNAANSRSRPTKLVNATGRLLAVVALGLVAVYLLAFGLSHPLGKAIESWPAVVLVSLVVGAVVWGVTARSPRAAL